ncbi:MAG: RNA polymerase sigma factor [bacterium]
MVLFKKLTKAELESSNDEVLAKAAQRKNKEAFAVLVKKFEKPIFNFIIRLYGNYDVAAELTQETFLRSFQAIKSYDVSHKFSTWLFSIAKNLCIDELRKKNKVIILSADNDTISTELIDNTLSDIEFLLKKEKKISLQKLILQLKIKLRTVLILRYFHDMSNQEISETLGININVVKLRLFRAKKVLLKMIEKNNITTLGDSDKNDIIYDDI